MTFFQMAPNYEINHSPSNKRLTTELMTQEQANAIAEREYPMSDDALNGRVYDVLHSKCKRAAYAKCLMDMNPLIEAGKKMKDEFSDLAAFASAHLPTNKLEKLVQQYSGTRSRKAWDTALSNLTKKNDHE